MNNGPWGSGMHPGYTSWSAQRGNVTFNPQSSFNPMTYQQKYAAPAQSGGGGLQAPQVDWGSMFGMGGGNAGGQGQGMNVNTSIQARPVYDQIQVNEALGNYNKFAPPGGGTAGNLYNQEAQRARIGTGRSMAMGNANMLLGSQKARSDAGLRWGALGNQEQGFANQQLMDRQRMAFALLNALS